jgi:hypothetical protein
MPRWFLCPDFYGSLADIGITGTCRLVYLVWYVRYFLYCKIWWELHFVKFCGNSPQKGGLVHQKGGRSERKRGSRQMYDTEEFSSVRKIPRKYQPISYHTEIPNRDATLQPRYAAHRKFTDTHRKWSFIMCMRERAKKSPFYVAYTQIGNLRIGNLHMRRKKLRKPSYAYMLTRYGDKEITAKTPVFNNIKGK